jgi:hypothetical protein
MQLQQEEADFYATQIDAYKTAYQNFSGIQNVLNAQFAPILAKGPNQFGFSDAEVQNLNTIATEGTAANYGKAKQALQDAVATQGGGTSNVNATSGATNQLQEELASEGAATQSATEQQIQQSGYAAGRQNWQQAVAGEEDLAAGWNPNSFAGSATGAGTLASNTANTITQEQNQMWGSIIGALGGIGGAAAGSWITKHG